MEGIAKITREAADELLTLELLRLDDLQCGLYGDAISGNLRALETCLRIMDLRARLLGLYQTGPTATVTVDGSPSVSLFFAGPERPSRVQ